MRENASISKEVRMDYELGCDRLSNLPLGMIHAILARVPIQDVVRTSILSRQWRYTWASLPQLDFISVQFIVVGDYPEDKLEDGNVCIRDFLSAHNFSFEKLRFVSIDGLTALFVEKELIKFLLESSPVLETMRLWHFISDTDEIQSAVDDLLGCYRASPSARISFSIGSG